jgi:type IV pilus assembly protein PilQ
MPRYAANTSNTGGSVRIKDVDYVDRDDAARVTFELSGPAAPKVLAASGKQAILEIPAAELAPNLERSLDTSEFSGPVTSISSYRDPKDNTKVRLVVDLAQPTTGTLSHDGNRWAWDFPKPVASRGKRTGQPRATSFAPPVVGSYGAISTPVTSQTVAQSTSGGGVQSGQRLTIDLKDADLHNLMRLFAQAGNVDIVVPDEVQAKITVKLTQVPWREAMEVVLASKGYWYKQVGRIIRVAKKDELIAEDEEEAKRHQHAVQQETPETEVFTLNYAKADDMLKQVQALVSPRGKVILDTRTNSLVITDISGNRAAMLALLRRLDSQTPQIQIEARVVEARSTFAREIGVQWGYSAIASAVTGNPTGLVFPSTIGTAGGATDAQTNSAGTQTTTPNFAVNLPAPAGTGSGGAIGFTFGSVGGNFNIALRLSAAEEVGTVRIVSAPKIMVLNNLTATISQGVSIPISVVSATGVQTQFVPADLSLKVTPHVSQRDCSIVLETNVKKNEADFVNTGARGDPSILRKEANTTLLMGDGETTVIGGIYTRNEGVSYKKVPFFADIPIIGWFFRSKSESDDRTEVLIFLTPKIVNRANLHCEAAPQQ